MLPEYVRELFFYKLHAQKIRVLEYVGELFFYKFHVQNKVSVRQFSAASLFKYV